MRRIAITIILSICSIIALGQTQRYQNRELALISFSYYIDSSIKSHFDTFGHFFPETENNKADRIIAFLKEYTWYFLKGRLESELGMYILPINAHGNSFKYDIYNFPNVTINQALKRGESKFYLKIDLSIISAIPKKEMGYGARPTEDTTIYEAFDLENSILPKITIEISTYNDKGILPLHKHTGSAEATSPWLISEDIFKGLINKQEVNTNETNTLLGLTNVCITSLIKKF
jgi:hypothetical protein